jgi:hypothetical protein
MKIEKIKSDDCVEYGYWKSEGNLTCRFVYHREDGPAVEYISGTKIWYFQGKYHREDGPAIEYINGDKSWYIYGNPHREDGPAIENAEYKNWYLEGNIIKEKDFEEALKIYNLSKICK